jgi:hypothetical protein
MYSHAELRTTAEDITLKPGGAGSKCLPDGFHLQQTAKQVGRRFTQVKRNVTQKFIKVCAPSPSPPPSPCPHASGPEARLTAWSMAWQGWHGMAGRA